MVCAAAAVQCFVAWHKLAACTRVTTQYPGFFNLLIPHGNSVGYSFMERKWCEKLRQAMSRVEKHKSIATARAVTRAAKRQCKKDERQTEALLAKARDWSAHVFEPQRADSLMARRRWSRSA